MRNDLSNDVAFVTAAGGAIAGAIAARFAEAGAKVCCIDIHEENLRKRVVAINEQFPGQAEGFVCDASDEDAVRSTVEKAKQRFGKISIVLNAAAFSEKVGSVVEMSLSDWNKVIAVNLTSVFLVCKYTAPILREAGGGSIINIGSTFGRVVVPKRPGYTTTKAAVIQLTKSMAIDLAEWNIRVNSISPGAIETARLLDRHPSMEAVREKFVPKHPIGRLGQPEEIANAALFLASRDASFITASDLLVDGGYTAI